MDIEGNKEERMETRLPAESKQRIEQTSMIRLTVDEGISLAEMMIAEPESNEKAVAAFRRYKETMNLETDRANSKQNRC